MAVIKIGSRFSAKIYTTCQRTMSPLVHVKYNLQQLLIMSLRIGLAGITTNRTYPWAVMMGTCSQKIIA
jgi:hypothetical protein